MRYVKRLYHLLRNLSVLIVAPLDFKFARAMLLSDASISAENKALVEDVKLVVHWNDRMYVPFNARHYLLVGLSAIRSIDKALAGASRSAAVNSILDFPSGHGRVLRFLRVKFPHAKITTTEIDQAALAFCSRTFSVKSELSEADFGKLSLSGKFDLIWCGSLITHLDEGAATKLLRFFHDHLSPGGRCLFTTHGQFSAECVEKGVQTYGLTAHAQQNLLSDFRAAGYGYADYKSYPGYGISIVSHKRMLELAGRVGQWHEVSFQERGWDNHQDVYCFMTNIERATRPTG